MPKTAGQEMSTVIGKTFFKCATVLYFNQLQVLCLVLADSQDLEKGLSKLMDIQAFSRTAQTLR